MSFLLFVSAIICLLGGCSEMLAPKTKAPLPHVHTVQWSGESLAIIAEWYTGDDSNTAALITANPSLTFGSLPIGQTVIIPGAIIETREPMPESFLNKDLPPKKEEPALPSRKYTSTYFVHTVTYTDESLSIIAAWYTGELQNWKKLTDVNPQLANPNRIKGGDRINIPENMLVTRKKMPLSHVNRYVKPQPKPKPKSKPKPKPKSKPKVEKVIIEEKKKELIEETPPKKEAPIELPIFGPR
jgi:LysM domain